MLASPPPRLKPGTVTALAVPTFLLTIVPTTVPLPGTVTVTLSPGTTTEVSTVAPVTFTFTFTLPS